MSTVDKCALAVTFAEDTWLCGAHVVQLILALSVLILACYFLLKKQSRRVAMHANLKVECSAGFQKGGSTKGPDVT